MLVGFKRLTTQIFDNDGKPKGDPIVIEGKQNKGATTKADISGLSKDPTKVAGSDITYYISRTGVGDVKADLGLLDVPEDEVDLLLGWLASESGISYLGDKTEAPYASMLLESSDGHGNVALLGFFRGTFSRDKVSMETLDPSETFKPEADDWSYSAMASDNDDETKGQYIGKYAGADEEAITKLREQILHTSETTTEPTAPKA